MNSVCATSPRNERYRQTSAMNDCIRTTWQFYDIAYTDGSLDVPLAIFLH